MNTHDDYKLVIKRKDGSLTSSYTMPDLAHLFRKSERVIGLMMGRGDLPPPVLTIGNSRLWDAEEVEKAKQRLAGKDSADAGV